VQIADFIANCKQSGFVTQNEKERELEPQNSKTAQQNQNIVPDNEQRHNDKHWRWRSKCSYHSLYAITLAS
jgi:hypothetical protein